MVGTYIKDKIKEIVHENMRLDPFSLYLLPKHRTLYATNMTEKIDWVQALKYDLGYSNFNDYYQFTKVMGKGKFGLVRLAIHKKTGKEVAVKTVKKDGINTDEFELIRREIEILKLCQHPNIIRLLDIFENIKFIYIVQEYMEGGDLLSYLERSYFTISEDRVRNIIHSLATALYYLHSYGIVHRDLKPENILMNDNSLDSGIKLVDFGLSKMIGPEEKCDEPFGTILYVAPEILFEKEYDKSVDLWSLGAITYLLLVGALPFDGKSEREIASHIKHDEPNFGFQEWLTISKEAIDFVSSI